MIVYQVVNEYKRVDGVISIMLVGSSATGRNDELSDIDIYIIVSKDIPVDIRKGIIKKFSDEMEVDNNFWGSRDEYIIRSSDIRVDIAYYNIDYIKETLSNTLENYNALTGYTTCFWHNINNSVLLFDKDGDFLKLKNKYNIPYPSQLKENIINKNYPILRSCFSSYYKQIEKDIKRGDLISVNHRVTAFLDSYFDIVFAVNEMTHPGEKRLINIVEKKCIKKPVDFSKNIYTLLERCKKCNSYILESLNNMVDNLEALLKDEELIR